MKEKMASRSGGKRIYGAQVNNDAHQPLISVVTVVYNGAGSIRKTIKSVLGQSFRNYEYLIIDGGSNDGTIDIIREYENLIDYWVSEKDEGISDAFNKGINLAKGRIVGIINADDWYEPDAFGLVADAFQSQENVDVVCGLVQYWKNKYQDYLYSSNPAGLFREMTVNHPSCFVAKAAYLRYGLFRKDYRYAMDYELMLRFRSAGANFVSLPSKIANMQLDGASDQNWRKSLKESQRAKAEILNSEISSRLYYMFQVMRRKTRDAFITLNLSWLVQAYRSKYSALKKYRPLG